MDKNKYIAAMREYTEVSGVRGRNALVRCIFHDDVNPSLSVCVEGEKQGVFNCFACGAKGNSFLKSARTRASSEEKVVASAVCAADTPAASGFERESCFLEDFAAAKRFDPEKLRSFGVYEEKVGDGTVVATVFPYTDFEGRAVYRKRRFGGRVKFDQVGHGGTTYPYVPKGMLLVGACSDLSTVFICEGESDTLAAAAAGYFALGIGGARGVAACWPRVRPYISGASRVLVSADADEAGDAFAVAVCDFLAEDGYSGEVGVVFPEEFGGAESVKDLSDLYAYSPESVRAAASGVRLEDARSASRRASRRRALVEGRFFLPVEYAYDVPEEYEVSEKGVFLTSGSKKVCALPVLWNGSAKRSDGSLLCLLTAYVRGEWTEYELPKRSVSRTSELVQAFCETGLPGASDANARDLMKYLAACEDRNINAPTVLCTDVTGWLDDRYYMPFAAPPNSRSGASWSSSGSWLEEWKRIVRTSLGARAAVSAAVGATLLRITGCRSHVAYLYGDSGGGKTAAQTAAAAFYGPPEEIMASMYGTTAGIELLAAKRNDMALVLDERQTMNDADGQTTVERIVYMLAGGVGKLRGSKDGDLAETARWRTTALISGEESLSKYSSKSGVFNRSLPLYGKPFADSSVAARCYPAFERNYGEFGGWIRYVVPRRNEIRAFYERVVEETEKTAVLEKCAPSPSHVRYIANMAAAEYFLCLYASMTEEEALAAARELIKYVLFNFEQDEEESSYSRRAMSVLCQFVFSNPRYFHGSAERRYGEADTKKGVLYMPGERLRSFLSGEGFDAGRVLSDWKADGLAESAKQIRINDVRIRCFEIRLPKEEIEWSRNAGVADKDD